MRSALHHIQGTITTERLAIADLSITDSELIHDLTNSVGWLRFIGDRNIATADDAKAYIQKILDNPGAHYWVVKLQGDLTPIGVVTLIKRDYLQHNDIGFAFLPQYAKKGFAFEAVSAVMGELKRDGQTEIYAITVKDNFDSIHLLEKIGLEFDREIELDGEVLLLYSVK